MRCTGIRSDLARGLLLAVLLGCAAMPARAQALIDPLFGLAIQASPAFIPPAPADLARSCPELTTKRWDRQAWVFAHVSDGGKDYRIIAGFFIDRQARDPSRGRETDSRGAIVVIADRACRLFGPVREVFDYGEEQLDAAILRRLAQDAVTRYAGAYGGMPALQAALRKHDALPDAKRSAILFDALAAAPVP
jgi:hypothetical protein